MQHIPSVIFFENATSPYRAGRGKRRRWGTAANSYCLANFERRAFLPQSFKRNCPQVWCTVTGGADLSTRKVTRCVRSDYKTGTCLNYTRSRHQTHPSTLFSPIFSLAREKMGPPEARQKRPRRNESLQARLLILCARFFLSKPQTEFAVWVL